MVDSRDRPELETLDYKPTIEELEKAIGMADELDILPNGQVRKKIHLVEQPPNNCDCLERPKIHTIECVANSEQPNQSIMIIEKIEGLMSQANEELEKLDGGHYSCVKAVKKGLALEEIDLFQKTTLFKLRKAFE